MTVTRSKLTVFTESIDLIKENARILIDAEEEARIEFDDQVVPTAFRILSDLTSKAAKMKPEELEEFVRHLREDGPAICQAMIEEMLRKTPPVMSRSYLEGRLIKPPSALRKDE